MKALSTETMYCDSCEMNVTAWVVETETGRVFRKCKECGHSQKTQYATNG